MRLTKRAIEGMPIAVFDEFYDEREQALIWQELTFLNNSLGKMLGPEHTGSASRDGVLLKANTGLELDSIYADRKVSNILQITRKLFAPKLVLALIEASPFFAYLPNADFDSTKVHYYDHGHEYQTHTDRCVITAVSWFCESIDRFRGGDLLFGSESVSMKSNRVVFFPSCLPHSSSPIEMEPENRGRGLGKYVISTFIAFRTSSSGGPGFGGPQPGPGAGRA